MGFEDRINGNLLAKVSFSFERARLSQIYVTHAEERTNVVFYADVLNFGSRVGRTDTNAIATVTGHDVKTSLNEI